MFHGLPDGPQAHILAYQRHLNVCVYFVNLLLGKKKHSILLAHLPVFSVLKSHANVSCFYSISLLEFYLKSSSIYLLETPFSIIQH